MKKRINELVAVIMLLILLSSVVLYGDKIQIIDEPDVPLTDGRVIIEQQKEDIQVIPDKYNTGCIESTITTIADVGTEVGGIYISSYGSSTNGIRFKENYPDNIVIENVDFSAKPFALADESKKISGCSVVFTNCKFDYLKTVNIKESNFSYIFNNCTITSFNGSNSTFNNCYFGDGFSGKDAVNPHCNVNLNNCMIANLIQKADSSGAAHVDGIQFFGGGGSNVGLDNLNVHMKNCRIEMPAVRYTYPTGQMNCAITFTNKYGSAKNITFEDLYVNGGSYYTVMITCSSGYTLEDIIFKNVNIGGSRKSKDVRIDDDSLWSIVEMENVKSTDSLYVGTVWKDSKGIHISATNDTNQDRKLTIVTSNTVYEKDIPACPVSIKTEYDSMSYYDYPFDIDVCVEDAEWVVCYDTTESVPKQIRFKNWGNNEVRLNVLGKFADDNDILIEEEEDEVNSIKFAGTKNALIASSDSAFNAEEDTADISIDNGECGTNCTYIYKQGVLTILGNGEMQNYTSKNKAPWYEYKDDIETVVIENGITSIGSMAFAECSGVKSVTIPDGCSSIMGNAFKKCSSLEEVMLPTTITEIGRYSFAGSSLKTVYYDGYENNWNEIKIGENNGILLGATIKFKEIELVEDVDLPIEGECGINVSYSFKNGVLTISGSGEMNNYTSKNKAPWNEYKDQIESVYIKAGVTSVGAYAFIDCNELKQVEIDNGCLSICGNAFQRCKSLKIVSLPKSIVKIGKYAFAGAAAEKISYLGTADEWSNISIGSSNTALENVEFASQ